MGEAYFDRFRVDAVGQGKLDGVEKAGPGGGRVVFGAGRRAVEVAHGFRFHGFAWEHAVGNAGLLGRVVVLGGVEVATRGGAVEPEEAAVGIEAEAGMR